MIKRFRKSIHSFLQTHWPLLAIIVVFVILRIVVLIAEQQATPSWDASVYVGMGKYLYSNGAIGTWEALRPIALPVILGGFWKLGIDPYFAGIVINMIVSAAFLVLVYFFAERLHKTSGAIAAALLAASSFFFFFSAVPVTDITSTFFAVWGLFLVYKAQKNRQYFIAGIVIALGFMFRFPQGLMLVVAMVSIFARMFFEKGKWSVKIENLIERAFSIAGGFFLIVVPYLISNYYFYNNAFLPFIEGTEVIKQYPSLYSKEIWFYGLELLKQNPLYLFAFAPIGMLWHKRYRSVGIIMLITAVVFVAGYFTYQSHKEGRYLLAFLPYVALLAGIGIVYVLERFKLPQLLFFGLFGIALFMASASMIFRHHENPDNAVMHSFGTYLSHEPGARVLTTTPYLLSYTDTFLVRNLYSDWNDAYWAYNTLKKDTDYILLNSCNLETGCADNARCKDSKQALLDALAKNEQQVFSATTPSQCVLSIHKLSH